MTNFNIRLAKTRRYTVLLTAVWLTEQPCFSMKLQLWVIWVRPTLGTTWVRICLTMFNAWHILCQQISDRRQLTGGGQVRNQPSGGFSCWYFDRRNYTWKDKFTLYHSDISPVWRFQGAVLRWSHINDFLMPPLYANIHCLFPFHCVISCISPQWLWTIPGNGWILVSFSCDFRACYGWWEEVRESSSSREK